MFCFSSDRLRTGCFLRNKEKYKYIKEFLLFMINKELLKIILDGRERRERSNLNEHRRPIKEYEGFIKRYDLVSKNYKKIDDE